MEPIFRVDGNRVVTSPDAAGPWHPQMQHGSAPASLVVWAAEAIPTPVPMRLARVTVDLMRPVPIAPLTVETEILREGRKIQLCAVRLRADGVIVAAASLLRIRSHAVELPSEIGDPPLALPGPEQSAIQPADYAHSPFTKYISMRAAHGRFGRVGSAAIWFRIDHPLIAGAAVSQAMRAVVAAALAAATIVLTTIPLMIALIASLLPASPAPADRRAIRSCLRRADRPDSRSPCA